MKPAIQFQKNVDQTIENTLKVYQKMYPSEVHAILWWAQKLREHKTKESGMSHGGTMALTMVLPQRLDSAFRLIFGKNYPDVPAYADSIRKHLRRFWVNNSTRWAIAEGRRVDV